MQFKFKILSYFQFVLYKLTYKSFKHFDEIGIYKLACQSSLSFVLPINFHEIDDYVHVNFQTCYS